MSDYKVVLPAMGEGVMEATIITWAKQIGEYINEDETLVEIATDKVDSEVPSPVSGTIKELTVPVDGVAPVNSVIAVIETEASVESKESSPEIGHTETQVESASSSHENVDIEKDNPVVEKELLAPLQKGNTPSSANFEGVLSPLVKSMIQKENISTTELAGIKGSGKEGRITKDDITAFLEVRDEHTSASSSKTEAEKTSEKTAAKNKPGIAQGDAANMSKAADTSLRASHPFKPAQATIGGQDEVIEMNRMRKLIAKHMVDSKQTSPHVTSFVEADLTNVVMWRNKHKAAFLQQTGQKLTFMPILIHALVKSIRDFPMINASVNGDTIIKKKDVNIGMAAALPNGNLIVPVIKRADQLSLRGLTERINDLANRARNNQLKPEEVTEGTYTITNVGSFGNIMGTPIINQPQVAIMAVGAIQKKPAVLETPQGDVIAVRHKMYLSHAYDHRVVDGALGGMFVKRMADYLENFDTQTEI